MGNGYYLFGLSVLWSIIQDFSGPSGEQKPNPSFLGLRPKNLDQKCYLGFLGLGMN